MRYVTVLGAGLLVGTALAVIVPEGVHALYLSELETNQMRTQHEFQANHKVIGRHLNEIKHEKNEPDVPPPAHEHTADRPRELGTDLEHKHTDTTHSAIGRRAALTFSEGGGGKPKKICLLRYYADSRFCIYVDCRQLWFEINSPPWKYK